MKPSLILLLALTSALTVASAQTTPSPSPAATKANFRQDVTPNGTINASDVGLVKTSSGHTVP